MITLVMILKNEEQTIVDTLLSVGPHIHRACIVDTGSTDRTCVLVAETLLKMGISHVIHQLPWKDYSYNRNQALDLARQITEPGSWLFMLSADARLEFTVPAEAPPGLNRGETITFEDHLPAFGPANMAVQLQTILGNWHYPQTCIFRRESDWKYRGVTHELPMSASGAPTVKPPQGVHVRYIGSGDKRARWKLDVELLLREIKQWGPNSRHREVYYLAQSYECLEDYNQAARWYHIRGTMTGGHKAEAWESKLRCTLLLEKISGMYGNPKFTPDDIRTRLLYLTKEKQRAEPWYYLAESYAEQADRSLPADHPLQATDALWELTYLHAFVAYKLSRTKPEQEFMLRRDVYEWRSQMALALAAYNTDRYQEARDLFTGMADNTSLGQDVQLLIRQYRASIDLEEKERAKRRSTDDEPDHSDSRDASTRPQGEGAPQDDSAGARPGKPDNRRRTVH